MVFFLSIYILGVDVSSHRICLKPSKELARPVISQITILPQHLLILRFASKDRYVTYLARGQIELNSIISAETVLIRQHLSRLTYIPSTRFRIQPRKSVLLLFFSNRIAHDRVTVLGSGSKVL